MKNMLTKSNNLKTNLFYQTTTFIGALLICANSFAYQAIDKTIAIIGEDIVFSSELDKRLLQAKIRLEARGSTFNEKKLRTRVLDDLILERLQLTLATRNNLSASKEEVQNALNGTQKNLQQSGLTFEQYIDLQQISKAEALQELEKEVLIRKVQQGAINQRISVTQKEIDNFLNSKTGQEWLTPRFHLGHIFLPATEKNKKHIFKEAKKIHQTLRNPKVSFRRTAQKYSKGPNAGKGGDLGVQTKDEMPELFSAKVDSLKQGDTSAPFYSAAGVHILKLFARNGAEPVIAQQFKVRHILVKASNLFTDEEAKNKIDKLYQRTISGEEFSQLAEENTDDIGSKLTGGDLGWSSPGVFVPAFETVMKKTPINKVSQPFKSQFGWHILTVEDIREKDIFETVKRQQVATILKRQRFQDELQIWLKELRERSYVELLI
jgi:peptidyl-prolyl cis-trans isomerase SurA